MASEGLARVASRWEGLGHPAAWIPVLAPSLPGWEILSEYVLDSERGFSHLYNGL